MEDNEILQLEMDSVLKKQLGFLGIIYQICGVLSIISGAMISLGIITAVIGVPYIMAGLKLFSSGSLFAQTAKEGQGEQLKSALGDLAKAMKLWLITMAGIIVFYIIFFIVMISFGAFSNSNF